MPFEVGRGRGVTQSSLPTCVPFVSFWQQPSGARQEAEASGADDLVILLQQQSIRKSLPASLLLLAMQSFLSLVLIWNPSLSSFKSLTGRNLSNVFVGLLTQFSARLVSYSSSWGSCCGSAPTLVKQWECAVLLYPALKFSMFLAIILRKKFSSACSLFIQELGAVRW